MSLVCDDEFKHFRPSGDAYLPLLKYARKTARRLDVDVSRKEVGRGRSVFESGGGHERPLIRWYLGTECVGSGGVESEEAAGRAIASLFHELGHADQYRDSQSAAAGALPRSYAKERDAWERGRVIIEKSGVHVPSGFWELFQEVQENRLKKYLDRDGSEGGP